MDKYTMDVTWIIVILSILIFIHQLRCCRATCWALEGASPAVKLNPAAPILASVNMFTLQKQRFWGDSLNMITDLWSFMDNYRETRGKQQNTV